MSKNIQALLFLICAAGLLIGCQSAQPAVEGSSAAAASEDSSISQPAAATALITPQELISKSEAESLLGQSVVDCTPTENAAVGQSLCFYDSQEENSSSFLQIGITQQAAMSAGSPNTPQSIYDTTKEAFGEDATMVDGIGDEAMLVTGGYYVMSDGYLLQIAAGNTDDQIVLSILDQAGSMAVANLKTLLGK